jgi:hypothetical protein
MAHPGASENPGMTKGKADMRRRVLVTILALPSFTAAISGRR